MDIGKQGTTLMCIAWINFPVRIHNNTNCYINSFYFT